MFCMIEEKKKFPTLLMMMNDSLGYDEERKLHNNKHRIMKMYMKYDIRGCAVHLYSFSSTRIAYVLQHETEHA